ncbi:hypothetical protein PGT21_013110 [Puccinia graminis f. sp. tritici]|uniref:Uncharacterized protein n=1 Tax=Puccinia graminis f. sp. tritici TaxID=56615 RepID=A0A5B0P6A7_PUCGR|nr:hypothetical protein PGT21_013110 [Puccinia graminis f. sp. tritici]
MVEGYPSRIPVIRWRIPASANGNPPTGADGPFSAKSWRVSGYPKGYPWPEGEMAGWKGLLPAGKPFRSTRYKYLVDWKDTLLVNEVQVPCRLEGHPSGRRGTSTLSTGRTPFRSTRYKYLVDWKDTLPVNEVQVPLPVDEVQVPRRLEGHPSGRRGTSTSSTGRTPFRSTRYKYLAGWKEALPVDEVQVPRRLEGHPSSRRGTSTSPAGRTPFRATRYKYLAGWKEALPVGPLEGGYPRIPARIPAAADGYPPAGADADSDAQMAGKSSRISASARISGCQSTISKVKRKRIMRDDHQAEKERRLERGDVITTLEKACAKMMS